MMMRMTSLLVATTLAVGIAGAAQAQDTRLRLATATSTGTFYQNGIAFEVLFRERVQNIAVFPQATGGSAENTRLQARGEVELFMGQNSTVIPAYEGTGQFDGQPNKGFSAVGAIWPSVMHVIVQDDDAIRSPADLKGRAIQIGPIGSGIERFTQQPLEAYGITFDDVNGQRLSVAEAVDQTKDGRIAGFFHAAIVPDRNAADVMSSGRAKILPIEGEAAQMLKSRHSFYDDAVIPAGSYENQPNDISTIANYAVLYVDNDVPEDVVYEIAKAIYENQEYLADKHASFNTATARNAARGLGPVPLHPGAERYLREVGAL